MIDNVIRNATNNTNTASILAEIRNIETRYFELPFIGIYSKVIQKQNLKTL